MKHIKQDSSLKAWVLSPGVDLGGGAMAKKFSQPKHMLLGVHDNSSKTFRRYDNWSHRTFGRCDILPSTTFGRKK